MKDLSLSDLITLRDYCYQESLGFDPMANEGTGMKVKDSKWHDRFKLCDNELSERVEKIFEDGVTDSICEFIEAKPSITNKLFETGGKAE